MPARRKDITEQVMNAIAVRMEAGDSLRQITMDMGLPYSTIRGRLPARTDWKSLQRHMAYNENGRNRAKWRPWFAARINKRLREGANYKQIAAELEVSHSAVSLWAKERKGGINPALKQSRVQHSEAKYRAMHAAALEHPEIKLKVIARKNGVSVGGLYNVWSKMGLSTDTEERRACARERAAEARRQKCMHPLEDYSTAWKLWRSGMSIMEAGKRVHIGKDRLEKQWQAMGYDVARAKRERYDRAHGKGAYDRRWGSGNA